MTFEDWLWRPDALDATVFAIGWLAGWLLLWRLRPLPAVDGRPTRRPVAVIVPARDEEHSLPHLLGPLVAQLAEGDQLVVVDDHSTDATAHVATELGATVVSPPPLPPGWLGKPHACWHGVRQTDASILVFLDADVRPASDLLDRLAAEVDRYPDSVVSVQPWHHTERPAEQASLLCNVAALMGSGAFTVLGDRVRPSVAFGPVLAVERSRYDAVGGHADPVIRTMHTEDIGIARAVGSARLFTGAPRTSFRMYPDGLRQTVAGWTRSLATGARFTPWWLTLLTLAWIWSLAGGWLTAAAAYPLSAVQVWVLGRRAGSLHPLTALLYPLAVAVFVVIFVRSALAVLFGRRVRWKQRDVDARSR